MTELIKYEVKNKTAVITLNSPKNYNALDLNGYFLLNRLVQQAAQERDTVATLIQSTGKFFSAGANVKSATEAPDIPDNATDQEAFFEQQKHWFSTFGARNTSLTETFMSHPKVLVIAMNGPAIGLSAALVAHADFIYALDNSYLLTPFANLGLVAEGAASYTLVQRLGLTKANEALLASKAIRADELYQRGFVNKLFKAGDYKSTEEFNESIQKLIEDTFYSLHTESVGDIKKLIRAPMEKFLIENNYKEVLGGVNKFSHGYPQERFAMIATGKLKHKL